MPEHSEALPGTDTSFTVVEVKANSLDNILDGERVDYIKFDVRDIDVKKILSSL